MTRDVKYMTLPSIWNLKSENDAFYKSVNGCIDNLKFGLCVVDLIKLNMLKMNRETLVP